MAQNTTENRTPAVRDAEGAGTAGVISSPISDEAYNIVACLHEKLQALDAYKKYSRDGNQIWQKMTQFDLDGVKELCGELERLVRDGKFRAGAQSVPQGQPQKQPPIKH